MRPKWTNVDLIGPNNNCFLERNYFQQILEKKLFIISQLPNNILTATN